MIAILATGVVFAMTLIMTGLSNGFAAEAERTVDDLGADAWLVLDGAAGPFLGASALPDSAADAAASLPGVEAAAPSIFSRASYGTGDDIEDVNLFGARTEGPGMPEIDDGRAPETAQEVAVSSALGADIGDDIELTGKVFSVVGRIDDSTSVAGIANVFATVEGAQAISFGGQPIATSIALRGVPDAPPDGFQVIDHASARDDFLRPLTQARSAITFVAILLWIVGALIVGSVVYLSVLERIRDFAVFKAVGTKTRSIMGGLALQAVIVALIAAAVGAALSFVLAPNFPLPVEIPASALWMLPVIAIAVGLAASLAGLRRAVTVDPALAFGGP
jgi:putative ABC transport system permease protein